MASIPDRAAPPSPFSPGRLAALLAILTLAVVALYLPTLRHAYVFDDEAHISGNPVVLEGLGADGVRWAITTLSGTSWHPLTWLSYMAVVEVFGPAPGPQHALGFLLHALNALLLMLALVRLTGALGRSAFAAALFALHPIHVESVACAAMRKDVLYAFFWLAALLAYVRHAHRPGPARYGLVAGVFALSLMSKPMAVTLPVALLVLDMWPLGRASGGLKPGMTHLPLGEKLPLLALSAAVVALTAMGGTETEVLVGFDTLPLAARLKNVPVSYVMYLIQTLWPSGMAVYYPLSPAGPPAWAWMSATAALAAFTALAFRERRRRPWLAAGWAWYLVTLLPVIGFLPIGFFARADRYTYLPLIGIFVIIAWGGRELLAGLRHGAVAGAAAAVFVLLLLAAIARVQVGFWRDPVSLFSHALVVTEGNWLAHYGLGQALRAGGDATAAAEHYRSAIALNPGYKEARNNLGILLAERGDPEGALAQFQEALRYRPRAADLHYNAGLALEALGRDAEAARAFRRAMDLEPGRADARAALDKLEGETR
jgi:tetratricopeptide (TPR) repeat protein